MSARAFPMPVHPPEGRPANWCRWCGGEIVHGRAKQRSWHDGRADEPKCFLAYQLHTRRDVQFAHVEARDGLKCWDCGEAPEKWLRGHVCFIGGESGFFRGGAHYVAGTRYQDVTRVTALELEHAAPLWAVAHLPADERRPFFGPDNLRLRCQACHAPKTKKEAGDRAKMKRLHTDRTQGRETAGTLKGGRSLPGKGKAPKMKSRPFPKGGRPLQSRNDLRRR